MNSPTPYRLVCLVTVFAALTLPGSADTLTLQNKASLTRPITRLTSAGVILDKNQMVSWTNLANLVFDRPPLQAPGQRLLLRNGIGLCGILARTTRDTLTFRSITAGELTVPWSEVTAIRYGQSNRFPDSISLQPGEILVVLNNDERNKGTLMGATDQQLVLRTPEGMKKMATENITWLIAFPTIFASRNVVILLRNGDRLNGPVLWNQNEFSVTVNGRTLNMDQAAIRAIINPGATPQEKE